MEELTVVTSVGVMGVMGVVVSGEWRRQSRMRSGWEVVVGKVDDLVVVGAGGGAVGF